MSEPSVTTKLVIRYKYETQNEDYRNCITTAEHICASLAHLTEQVTINKANFEVIEYSIYVMTPKGWVLDSRCDNPY